MGNSWAELNDFSEYEGSIPCVLCQAESSKTLVGDHWKCTKCTHLFNKDGSETKLTCICDKCRKEQEAKEPKGMSLEGLLEQMGKLQKKLKQPKKKVAKKKKKI